MGSSHDGREYPAGAIHGASATTLLIQRLHERVDEMRSRISSLEMATHAARRLIAALDQGAVQEVDRELALLRVVLEEVRP